MFNIMRVQKSVAEVQYVQYVTNREVQYVGCSNVFHEEVERVHLSKG